MSIKISIVIPTFNEQGYIDKCLNSFHNQSIDNSQFEVLVCDGISTDETVSIVSEFEALANFNCKLLLNKKRKTPYALNLGIKHATGKYITIFGAHAEADVDFCKNIVEFLEVRDDIACVGGILENVYENDVSKTIGKAMSSNFGVGNVHFRTGNFEGEVDTVAFGAYRKEVFEKIGYFDEDLTRNQDDEFNFRLTKSNLKIYLLSKIKARYFVRASYKKLFKQYLQYGYWKVFVNKKHKAVTSIRQLIPPLFVAFLILGFVTSFIHPIVKIIYILILLAYFSMGFYKANQATNNLQNSFMILFTFFILHLSYGWGYLKGMFHFILFDRNPTSKQEEISR